MNETQEIFRVILPSYNQSSKVVHPGEHAFDFPTATKTSQCPSILGLTFRSTALTMGRDYFRTELTHHLTVERVAVVGFVSDQSLRRIGNKSLLDRAFDQCHFSSPGLVGFGYDGVIANNLFRLIPKRKIHPTFFCHYFSKREAE